MTLPKVLQENYASKMELYFKGLTWVQSCVIPVLIFLSSRCALEKDCRVYCEALVILVFSQGLLMNGK